MLFSMLTTHCSVDVLFLDHAHQLAIGTVAALPSLANRCPINDMRRWVCTSLSIFPPVEILTDHSHIDIDTPLALLRIG